MKKTFIREVWGEGFDVGKDAFRGGKLYNDIISVVNNDKEPEFLCYVFGKQNFDALKKLNVNCVLVDQEPVRWSMEKELYRHKLEIFKIAMEENDEIVFLDWDCGAVKECSELMWDVLGKKESLQAPLMSYRTKKCLWRKEEIRKVPNAGFVYIRDNTIPAKLISIWEEFGEYLEKRKKEKRPIRFREQCLVFQEEPAMAKFIDDMMGGWIGIDKYWDLFEPMVCNLSKNSPFNKDMLNSKDIHFIH